MKRNNKKKGFTIVELVIVIAVIAILAAVLIPTFSGIVDKAEKSAALQEATSAYKNTLGNVEDPDELEDLQNIKVEVEGVTVYITGGEASIEAPANTNVPAYEIDKTDAEKGAVLVCANHADVATDNDFACDNCGEAIDHVCTDANDDEDDICDDANCTNTVTAG